MRYISKSWIGNLGDDLKQLEDAYRLLTAATARLDSLLSSTQTVIPVAVILELRDALQAAELRMCALDYRQQMIDVIIVRVEDHDYRSGQEVVVVPSALVSGFKQAASEAVTVQKAVRRLAQKLMPLNLKPGEDCRLDTEEAESLLSGLRECCHKVWALLEYQKEFANLTTQATRLTPMRAVA